MRTCEANVLIMCMLHVHGSIIVIMSNRNALSSVSAHYEGDPLRLHFGFEIEFSFSDRQPLNHIDSLPATDICIYANGTLNKCFSARIYVFLHKQG